MQDLASDTVTPFEGVKACALVAKLHPFSDTVVAFTEPGQTLAALLGPDVSRAVHVVVGGQAIPREWWGHVRTKPGVPVEVTIVPQGGNAGKAVRLVALVVLTYFTAGVAAGAYGGIFAGMSSAALTATAAGLQLVGMMAINSLIPPPVPKLSGANGGDPFQQLQSITGTSNQANPYGAIPCVVGRYRFAPSDRAPRAVAVHEAGHAVAAWVVGKGVERVSVQAAGAGSYTKAARCLIEGDTADAVAAFCDGLTRAQLCDVVLREMVQAMAGPMAEGREKGWGLTWAVMAEPGQRDVRPGEPPSDLMAWLAMAHLLKPKDRARTGRACAAVCAELLAVYWPQVEAVATLLQRQGTVTAADLVPILGAAPPAGCAVHPGALATGAGVSRHGKGHSRATRPQCRRSVLTA